VQPIDRDPANLYPGFAKPLTAFIADWNHENPPDHQVGLFEGRRFPGRQLELWNVGRVTPGQACVHDGIARPLHTCPIHPLGRVVTMSPPGMGWHEFGLAADVVFDSDHRKPALQASWDARFPWDRLGKCGQDHGLEWAGAWKVFRESPHFQKKFGLQTTEAAAIYHEGGAEAVWKAATNELLLAG